MSIAEKLTTIAENEQKVYNAGLMIGSGDIWDGLQNYGRRTNYENGFRYWSGATYIRPKYKVVLSSQTRPLQVFENCFRLIKVEGKYFDFSNTVPIDSVSSNYCNYSIFRNCEKLEEIEDVGIQAGGYNYTFGWCPKLHAVEVMRCKKEGEYTNPFRDCASMKNLTIEGVIGNNFTMIQCPLLTKDSLMSIISALYDFSGTEDEYTRTLTLNRASATTLNKLGDTSPNGNTWIEYIDDKKWNLTLA